MAAKRKFDPCKLMEKAIEVMRLSVERSGWEWISTKEKTTSSEYATALKMPNRTALNHLKRFTELRLLRKTGSGPATVYLPSRT